MSPKSSCYQLQPTPIPTNFTDFANRAYSPLVLGMILAAIKSTDFERRTRVDRGVRCSTDVEFGKLIEFDFMSIVWIAFALSLDLFCL
jgi:hypothetical protein